MGTIFIMNAWQCTIQWLTVQFISTALILAKLPAVLPTTAFASTVQMSETQQKKQIMYKFNSFDLMIPERSPSMRGLPLRTIAIKCAQPAALNIKVMNNTIPTLKEFTVLRQAGKQINISWVSWQRQEPDTLIATKEGVIKSPGIPPRNSHILGLWWDSGICILNKHSRWFRGREYGIYLRPLRNIPLTSTNFRFPRRLSR